MSGGILLIDKPKGLTSAATLNVIKKQRGLRKIGHAGTLDPFATGLLVCLVGSATRLASFAEAGDKTYSGVMRLGIATDTDDITGKILSKDGRIPPFDAIRRAASNFIGSIDQVPPAVSAIKVGGIRSYELHRRGKTPCLVPRRVTLSCFDLGPLDGERLSFLVRCSKGTYIRSLARDLGNAIGCGCCVEELRRLRSEPFSLENTASLDHAENAEILDWRVLFPDAAELDLLPEVADRLSRGDQRMLDRVTQELDAATRAIYGCRGEALGLLVRSGGQWEFGVNIGD